jgi:YHS domain-containing protein
MLTSFIKPLPADLLRKTVPAFAIPVLMLLFSCNQQPKEKASFHSPAYSDQDSTKPRFTRDMVDNLKDPSCGMPLTAGVEDTLHYAGKVYGFCSDECRDEFKKNPAALAKTAVMKK